MVWGKSCSEMAGEREPLTMAIGKDREPGIVETASTHI